MATARGIERHRLGRAECEVAIPAKDGFRFTNPSVVDDGPLVLFDRGRYSESDSGSWGDRYALAMGNMESGTISTLIPGAWTPTFIAPDLVLYAKATPEGSSGGYSRNA
ncbi:MAG: hypothetical protein IPK85_21005 [Gemmatimonadetes bacterium]|nr:hypothetical protein [Gemmatimonadota bacterium]